MRELIKKNFDINKYVKINRGVFQTRRELPEFIRCNWVRAAGKGMALFYTSLSRFELGIQYHK